MYKLIRRFSLVWIVFLPGSAAAQQVTPETRELIVRLPPAADPVAVVEAINTNGSSGPIPYGLATGSPQNARLLLEHRPVLSTLTFIQANPDRPLSKLYRYLVVTYPEGTDVASLRSTLQQSGQLENVAPNLLLQMHSAVVPTDPRLGLPGQATVSAQWGTHALRLPQAWEWSQGNTPIGFLDTGVRRDHEDLTTWTKTGNTYFLAGGNVREHLSYNQRLNSCDIGETAIDPNHAGHGSHTSGIAAAATNNAKGVTGACWNCPVEMQLTFARNENGDIDGAIDKAANGLEDLVKQGVPILSMSFALSGFYECPQDDVALLCDVLSLAEERDTVMTASSGNDLAQYVGFPAKDSRLLACGGTQLAAGSPGFARWADCATFGRGCGSNAGPEIDLVAPAKEVLSTVYKGLDHLPTCGDSSDGILDDGYGLCTGTSMSAPYVAGIAGLVRSVQPLLTKAQVRDILTSTATHATSFSNELGYGMPRADAALQAALGSVRGQTLNNRLTPLFNLYSAVAGLHVLTPWPSEALAFLFDPDEPFIGEGSLVPGYRAFPGYEGCTVSPCPVTTPRSSFSVFTSARPVPGLPSLIPLYRVRFDPNSVKRCLVPRPDHDYGRSFAYATSKESVEFFKNQVTAPVNGAPLGYDLDGILGYIFPRCSPEPGCIPAGAVPLRRFYHPGRDDYHIFPDTETAYWISQGYQETTLLTTVLGYVYPNADTDFDGLIDGFESLIGTSKTVYDTDCDGVSDGTEALSYDEALHGYRDPLEGPCGHLFADGFETADTRRWSTTASGLDDGVGF